MGSAKESSKSVIRYINRHKAILASAFLLFIVVVLYLIFTQMRLIDADTAVNIPMFLITAMTLTWNIAHLLYEKRDETYRLLLLIPALFVGIGIAICLWLLLCTLSNITFLDWYRLFIAPVITALIGIVQPMINDIINPEETNNLKNNKKQRMISCGLYLLSFGLLCFTTWML